MSKDTKTKKVYYDKRRHIKQKTPADCKLASMAMLFNMAWENIVDLYSSEVLSAIVDTSYLKLNKDDPDYFDNIFNEIFYEPEGGFSGMTDRTTAWLLSVLGVNRFVELPFLIKGVPCIVNTLVSPHKEPQDPSGYEMYGHALYWDGYFIYDPNWDASDNEFEARDFSKFAEYTLPHFTTFTYLIDEIKDPEKFLRFAKKIQEALEAQVLGEKLKRNTAIGSFFVVDTALNYTSQTIDPKNKDALVAATKQPMDYDEGYFDDIFIFIPGDEIDKNRNYEIIMYPSRTFEDINHQFKSNRFRTLSHGKLVPMEYPVGKSLEWFSENFGLYSPYNNSEDFWKENITLEEAKKLLNTKKAKNINDQIFKRKRNPIKKAPKR